MRPLAPFATFLVALLLVPGLAAAAQVQGPVWHLEASDPYVVGGYGDNMVYDGSDIRHGTGAIEIHVDSDRDVGFISGWFQVPRFNPSADLDVENALVGFVQPLFGAPPGAPQPEYWEGGIAAGKHLHGDSGNEAPIIQSVNTPLATWGPVLVFLNGKQLMNPDKIMGMENPMGLYLGHMMYTEWNRDDQFRILKSDGTCCYSPMSPGDAKVIDPDRFLVHMVARSDTEDRNNFPAFDWFFHANFSTIRDAEPKDIPELTWEKMSSMSQQDLMANLMQMLPAQAMQVGQLPQTGAARPPRDVALLWVAIAGGILLLAGGAYLSRRPS